MRIGVWEGLSWDSQMSKCLGCHLRFRMNPTCSLDFMTIGDTDAVERGLGEFLDYALTDPPWSDLPTAVHEVRLSYSMVGAEVPTPMVAMQDFLESCIVVDIDSDFWKQWNYLMVEGFDAKPVRGAPKGDLSPIIKKIMENLLEPTTYWGERLFYLHSAASIILNFGINEERPSLTAPFGQLTEATRKAIDAVASLKIS
jgi:hypothetical protein